MKKIVEIYSKISCGIAIIVCVSLGYYALMSAAAINSGYDSKYIVHENMFMLAVAFLLMFTLYNGIALFIASVYLFFIDSKKLAIVNIVVIIIFYSIYFFAIEKIK